MRSDSLPIVGNGPRVSVLVPTYDSGHYIVETIESILAQTMRDFELIVLDNASADDTAERVAGFDDERLRYVRHRENLGFRGNCSAGRRLARGRFIVFVGADDIWERELLDRAVAFFDANPGISFLHTGAHWIDEDGIPYGGTNAKWAPVSAGRDAFVDVFREGFCFSGMLMRSDLVERLGEFEPRWDWLLDVWLFLHLCAMGDAGYLEERLVRYRVHSASLSSDLYREGRGFRQHLQVVSEAFEWPEARALGLGPEDRRRALRAIAMSSAEQIHSVRIAGSRTQLVAAFGALLGAAPGLALRPSMWARLAFGLLPRRAILGARVWKRRRGASHFASPLSADSADRGFAG